MDDMSRAGDEDERRRRLEGLRALAGGQEQQARQDTAPSGSGGRGRGRSS